MPPAKVGVGLRDAVETVYTLDPDAPVPLRLVASQAVQSRLGRVGVDGQHGRGLGWKLIGRADESGDELPEDDPKMNCPEVRLP